MPDSVNGPQSTPPRVSLTPPTPSAGPGHGPQPVVPRPPTFSWPMLAVLLLMLFGMWVWRSTVEGPPSPEVGYSQFFRWLEQGQIESVELRGSSIRGKLKGKQALGDHDIDGFMAVLPPDDPKVLELLREKGVDIKVSRDEQPFAVQLILTMLPWLLVLGLWMFLSRRVQNIASGNPFGGLLKTKSRRFEKSAQVDVTFDDVAGLKAAKQDLREVVDFLKEPERFRRLGGKVPRGVLLIGPPGTGKTLLARAVAGESQVAFFSISASEFIEMFVGVGAARVRQLFEDAKKNAPAIVFIDEIDAVGRSRGAGLGGGHDEREQTLNQLLSEMDGFDRNDLTIVLAATNRPDVLDPALLRPGRFDRRVIVDRPELAARRAILGVHTKNKPLGPSVDLQQVADATPGFSGADLANLVNEAALFATRRGADAIEREDFLAAYDKIVLGDPREAKLDVDEKHRVAVHEAGHAIVAHFASGAESPTRVSIIPRGMALGVTQQAPSGDRHIMTQSQLAARLMVLMGGYAAEKVILEDISTGAENDLKQATELASKMVAHYGMSDRIGPVYYEHQSEHPFLGQRIATDGGTSDATISVIESEARRLLSDSLDAAKSQITRHRPVFDELVRRLLDQETLEREDLAALFGSVAPPLASQSSPA